MTAQALINLSLPSLFITRNEQRYLKNLYKGKGEKIKGVGSLIHGMQRRLREKNLRSQSPKL
jgi:hypothetical protein